jgi:hypothetical protein
MVGLSILAITFHYLRILTSLDLPSIFQPLANIFNITIERRQSAYIHTFFFYDLDKYRNAGMFWEAGAYAGYLILSIIMLRLIKDKLYKKEFFFSFFIFSIALLSTK